LSEVTFGAEEGTLVVTLSYYLPRRADQMWDRLRSAVASTVGYVIGRGVGTIVADKTQACVSEKLRKWISFVLRNYDLARAWVYLIDPTTCPGFVVYIPTTLQRRAHQYALDRVLAWRGNELYQIRTQAAEAVWERVRGAQWDDLKDKTKFWEWDRSRDGVKIQTIAQVRGSLWIPGGGG
jgi:hypothetical protein